MLPPLAERVIVVTAVPIFRPLQMISLVRSRSLPCTLMRIFCAVRPLPIDVLPMVLPSAASDDAGTSMKELTLPGSSALVNRGDPCGRPGAAGYPVVRALPPVLTFACCCCAWAEDCPCVNATGNCKFNANAEAPQLGVVAILLSEPRGIWKVLTGPVIKAGLPFK